jgi:hypothetical protein
MMIACRAASAIGWSFMLVACSIISRTDIFQRALAAKREFYKEMAAYGEDYLTGDDFVNVSGWLAGWLAAGLAGQLMAGVPGGVGSARDGWVLV